jgi:hypothetical protein
MCQGRAKNRENDVFNWIKVRISNHFLRGSLDFEVFVDAISLSVLALLFFLVLRYSWASAIALSVRT